MARMKGIQKIGGVWKVRRRIPPECRADFGVDQFFTQSLGTKDEREAIRLGDPILNDIDRRIAEIRERLNGPAKPSLNVLSAPVPRLNPDAIRSAFKRWRVQMIDEAYDASFNGERREATHAEHNARADLMNRLGKPEGEHDIPDFYERMVAALRTQSVLVPADHPALRNMSVRQWFKDAAFDVELKRKLFDAGIYDVWPEADANSPLAASAPVSVPPSGMKLSALRDAWDAHKPLDSRQKGYITRLIEYLDDPAIDAIQPLDLDRFLALLKRFPKTKRDLSDIGFERAIAEAAIDPNYAKLAPKTVWNWTVTYKGMFAYAVSRRLLAHNPAGAMMKKPSADEATERLPYDEADIAFIFSRPMFTGFEGNPNVGYRDREGDEVVRDSKYWLPITALLTGLRLEELASLQRTEIKEIEGVTVIDLTGRPTRGAWSVKNTSARRIVPISDKLRALGFMDFVDMFETQQPFVFAGLTERNGKRGSGFGKWWGLWCEANAEKAGEGIDAPDKTFHSFRHAWKRAARMSSVKEEIHDLLSGHSEGNSVARGYGRGVDVHVLKTAIDAISFPSMPFAA